MEEWNVCRDTLMIMRYVLNYVVTLNNAQNTNTLSPAAKIKKTKQNKTKQKKKKTIWDKIKKNKKKKKKNIKKKKKKKPSGTK